MKRIIDFIFALIGLLLFSPIILPVIIIVFLQDFKSPFYVAPRVGKNEKIFKMIKIRSMIVDADKSGVDSTSSNDMRITKIGKVIRKFKLDEISQLYNVLVGDMSLVGPRPNVKRETDLYTLKEKKLLTVQPGITDFSSIIFSDEGEILANSLDPDLDYNQLIRPWKSRLGIFYILNRSLILDLQLIVCTVIAIISKKNALKFLSKKLSDLGADENLVAVSSRNSALRPTPPPGSKKIVTTRD